MAAHLRQAALSTGLPDEAILDREFELPREVQYLWNTYCELHATRNSGFGPCPINYQEILSWSWLVGVTLTPWELTVIRKIDNVYLEDCHARSSQPTTAE